MSKTATACPSLRTTRFKCSCTHLCSLPSDRTSGHASYLAAPTRWSTTKECGTQPSSDSMSRAASAHQDEFLCSWLPFANHLPLVYNPALSC